MKMTPQNIQANNMNYDIQQAAQIYQRKPDVQPVYANMDASLKRQGTWEEAYQKKNTFEIPPPPNYGNNNNFKK